MTSSNYVKEYYMDIQMHNKESEYYDKMMRILYNDENIIIFHHNDNDGRLAAFTIAKWVERLIVESQIQANIIYVECSHISGRCWKDFFQYIPLRKQNSIFAVDLSLSKSDVTGDVIQGLNMMCKIWSDHHLDTQETKQAVESGEIPYNVDFHIYHRNDMCGAEIAYFITQSFSLDLKNEDRSIKLRAGFISLQDMPEVHRLVGIRDRFIMDSPDWGTATGLYIASSTYSTIPSLNSENNLWYICTYNDEEFNKIVEKGISLKNYRDSMYNIFFKATGVKVTGAAIDGDIYDFIAVNAVGGSELFGGEDLKPDYDFCMVYYYTGKQYKYSIFTNKDTSKRGTFINLQKIAASFGGGGHLHAAGFVLPINLIDTTFKGMTSK